MGSMDDVFGLIGQTIDGRYRVDAVIGEGGFGVVYRGHHLHFDHAISIKCLKTPPHFTADARRLFFERFREEGKLLSRLSESPGIVRVYDFGVFDGRIPYLALEWLQGQTLESYFKERATRGMGPLAPEAAMRLLLPVVEAMAAAHRSGVVHRDLKPANVMIAQSSRGATTKVLDFGIAKALQEGEAFTFAATGTSTGFQAFSPGYAAPEQFFAKRFGSTGPWTDAHALGLMLVEAMTGRRPYAGDEYAELHESATSPTRPTPRALGAAVPDAIEAVCQRALALMPSQRFQGAAELYEAIVALVGEARPIPTPPAMAAFPPMSEASPSQTIAATPSAALPMVAPSAPVIPSAVPVTANGPGWPAASANTTGAAWAGGPTGPQIPMPPPRAPMSRRTRSALPIVAAVVGVCGIVGAALLARTVIGDRAQASASASSDGASPPPDGVQTYVNAVFGRELIGVDALAPDEARSRYHTRMERKGGVIVAWESVVPGGRVNLRRTIERGGGGLTVRVFDAYGVETAVETRGANGTVTTRLRSGVIGSGGCHHHKLSFDERGRPVRSECFDGADRVVPNEEGCEVVLTTYDDAGHPLSSKCVHADRSVAKFASGEHERRMRYERGLEIERALFSSDGSPVADVQGCVKRSWRHNAKGEQQVEHCFDGSGKIARETRYTYDARPCIASEEHFASDGKPIAPNGVATTLYRRDDKCGVLRQETRAPDGKLVGAQQHPAISEYVLDARGLVIESRCRDTSSSPVSCSAGTGTQGALVKTSYDERGREIRRRGFSMEGAATGLTVEEPHEVRISYGEDGRAREYAWFDAMGNPGTAFGGAARRRFSYDSLGAQLATSFFDANGAPMLTTLGCHELRMGYDEHHRLVSWESRGPDGKLRAANICAYGVCWPPGTARVGIERAGGTVTNVFYDTSGTKLDTISCDKQPCYR
jgi:serine/threonine protein kinase